MSPILPRFRPIIEPQLLLHASPSIALTPNSGRNHDHSIWRKVHRSPVPPSTLISIRCVDEESIVVVYRAANALAAMVIWPKRHTQKAKLASGSRERTQVRSLDKTPRTSRTGSVRVEHTTSPKPTSARNPYNTTPPRNQTPPT